MSVTSPSENLPTPQVLRRCRPRANYFVPQDIVWTRPAGLPYWPAEVVEVEEGLNKVTSRLLLPPPAELLTENLKQLQQQWVREKRRAERKKRKTETTGERDSEQAIAEQLQAVRFDPTLVIAGGGIVFFFDKLSTPEEFEECMEHRLKRDAHDVSAYESALYKAVLHANRLVRIPLSPEMLKPYEVCGVGVVHSLMRCHTAAPRQPNTGTFTPQTALIRLRKGLENAVRDLSGFEFIWVLFQFSYAAALATGTGQDCVRQMRQGDKTDAAVASVAGDPMRSWRKRQGVANSAGFKAMVIPPRDDALRGVFATRSPHRPNFIGLSCVRLVAVHGLDIHIVDHDLLHGTPVLDIKPYLPFCDAHPDAKAGWVQALDAKGGGKADHKYDSQVMFVHRIFEDDSTA